MDCSCKIFYIWRNGWNICCGTSLNTTFNLKGKLKKNTVYPNLREGWGNWSEATLTPGWGRLRKQIFSLIRLSVWTSPVRSPWWECCQQGGWEVWSQLDVVSSLTHLPAWGKLITATGQWFVQASVGDEVLTLYSKKKTKAYEEINIYLLSIS